VAERAGVEEEVGATAVEEREEVVKAAATGEVARVAEMEAAEKGGAREVAAMAVATVEEVKVAATVAAEREVVATVVEETEEVATVVEERAP